MKEDFLHYIWKKQYFDKPINGVEGEQIAIKKTGSQNFDAGPDFSDAHIIIDGITWIGHVEIHVTASEWYAHGHQSDLSYDNTILHVVWKADKIIRRQDNTPIVTIELSDRVDPIVYEKYLMLQRSPETVACSSILPTVDSLTKLSVVHRVGVERLMKKSVLVREQLDGNKGDWEEVTYRMMVKNFGFKLNGDPFFRLAVSLPLKYILKCSHLVQVESLLFGQAGLLENNKLDEYGLQMSREYNFFKHKYNLQPAIHHYELKFMRTRPANFPTIRLAQLSGLLFKVKHLFSWLTSTSNYREIVNTLMVKQSQYWQQHYHFMKSMESGGRSLGSRSAELIVMNTVVPILAAYSQETGRQDLMDRAIKFLESIPPENNKVIRMWADYGWQSANAQDTQALLELYQCYCKDRKCTSCNIGASIIEGRYP